MNLSPAPGASRVHALIQQAERLEHGARYADGPAWSHERQRAARLRDEARQLQNPKPREESRLAAIARRVAASKTAREREQAAMRATEDQLRELLQARRAAARQARQHPEAA